MRSPVIFIIFNRPDTTAKVFSRIREARPPRLLVIADGPRPSRPEEAARCAQARNIVIDHVDWPCEVLTCFSETNMGCRRRVSSGLSWAFSLVEQAVILEDDCLPHPSFFSFCDELLARYAHDERVGHIGGTNFCQSDTTDLRSYRWARYYPIWGWASWRRAWRDYDVDMRGWGQASERASLKAAAPPRSSTGWWEETFDKMFAGFDTWDCQLTWANWRAHRLAAVPSVNLVSNIGFGNNATHTHRVSRLANLPLAPMKLPLQHPMSMIPDTEWEQRVSRQQYSRPWIFRRVADVVRWVRSRLR